MSESVFDQPVSANQQTPAEIAGHELIDYIAHMRDEANGSFDLHCSSLADVLEDVLVRQEASRITTPALLEVTGNVAEGELAARLCEAKAEGAKAFGSRFPHLADSYALVAQTYLATAADFRAGLHLPHVVIEGRVIPYNESNDTGLRHADQLRAFFTDAYARNLKAGWWTDIATGEIKKRNVGELLMLFVTEIIEAYDAYLDNAEDDKLPQYPGLGVEMGDLLIRAADLCGAAAAGALIAHSGEPDANPGERMLREVRDIARRYESIRKTPAAIGPPETADYLPPMDIAEMVDAKLDFNAHRPDHKIENRLKEDGKRT